MAVLTLLRGSLRGGMRRERLAGHDTRALQAMEAME
jgi:hypothetical protein